MRALLDVSVLLAAFDTGHIFHARAISWWVANKEQGWASCPLTENGFVRIITQARYPRRVSIADAAAALRSQIAEPGHELWPDDASILDTAMIDHSRLLGPHQLTDVYLLALAVKHSGRLVTLDTAISVQAVKQARKEQLIIF